MDIYEYKVVSSLDDTKEPVSTELNRLAEMGFRVINVSAAANSIKEFVWTLERKKNSQQPYR